MQLLLLRYREDIIEAKVSKEHVEEALKSEILFLKDQVRLGDIVVQSLAKGWTEISLYYCFVASFSVISLELYMIGFDFW